MLSYLKSFFITKDRNTEIHNKLKDMGPLYNMIKKYDFSLQGKTKYFMEKSDYLQSDVFPNGFIIATFGPQLMKWNGKWNNIAILQNKVDRIKCISNELILLFGNQNILYNILTKESQIVDKNLLNCLLLFDGRILNVFGTKLSIRDKYFHLNKRIKDVKQHPNGKLIVLSDTLSIYDPEILKCEYMSYSLHVNMYTEITILRDGRIVIGSDRIYVYNFKDMHNICNFSKRKWIQHICELSDNKIFCSFGDNYYSITDIDTLECNFTKCSYIFDILKLPNNDLLITLNKSLLLRNSNKEINIDGETIMSTKLLFNGCVLVETNTAYRILS